jgi:3-isopropylmalate/(R)-2-methylmalate dehydratase small subunit
MSEPIRIIRSRTAVLPVDDVDTDQIIPARFLKGTTRAGLGRRLFADWRYDAEGRPRADFFLNRPEAAGAEVLVAGRNFGCGSSREHAPWALRDHGFRAVVSTSFADIFRNNALKNGLLPVAVDAKTHQALLAAPGSTVAIDLEAGTLALDDGSRTEFQVEPFARYCLLNGIDELTFLLSLEPAIAAHEARGAASGGVSEV